MQSDPHLTVLEQDVMVHRQSQAKVAQLVLTASYMMTGSAVVTFWCHALIIMFNIIVCCVQAPSTTRALTPYSLTNAELDAEPDVGVEQHQKAMELDEEVELLTSPVSPGTPKRRLDMVSDDEAGDGPLRKSSRRRSRVVPFASSAVTPPKSLKNKVEKSPKKPPKSSPKKDTVKNSAKIKTASSKKETATPRREVATSKQQVFTPVPSLQGRRGGCALVTAGLVYSCHDALIYVTMVGTSQRDRRKLCLFVGVVRMTILVRVCACVRVCVCVCLFVCVSVCLCV